jgi:hypothetical protein
VINAGGESVQCVMRNVGTFNLAESGVGIAELRGTNMKDVAQGGGVALRPNADGDNNPANDPKAGIGYNVPSLLGLASGAPYMHAGNARTLEAMLKDTFSRHHTALAPNFLLESDPKQVERQVDELHRREGLVDHRAGDPTRRLALTHDHRRQAGTDEEEQQERGGAAHDQRRMSG